MKCWQDEIIEQVRKKDRKFVGSVGGKVFVVAGGLMKGISSKQSISACSQDLKVKIKKQTKVKVEKQTKP